MADQTISLKLVIDPSGAITGVQQVGAETVKQTQRVQKETSALTGFIKEQRAENRQQNFLLREGAQSIGALSLAVTAFGGVAKGQMKTVTDSVGTGIVAFQGFNFAMGAASRFLPALGGPWGIAIAAVSALAIGIASMGKETDSATEKIKKQREEIDVINKAYDDWSARLKGTAAANRAVSREESALLKARIDVLKDIIEQQQSGAREITVYWNDIGKSAAVNAAATNQAMQSTGKTLSENKEQLKELERRFQAATAAANTYEVEGTKAAEGSEVAIKANIDALRKEQELLPITSARYAELSIEIDILTRKLNAAKNASDAFIGPKLPPIQGPELPPEGLALPGSIKAIEQQIAIDRRRLRETDLQSERKYLQQRIDANQAAIDEMNMSEQQRLSIVSSTLSAITQAVGQYTVVGKAAAIFQSTINTYEAITKALTAGPILGPILAGVIGALGFAQVAQIASAQPPSFAQGGLVFGPTLALVGDNPNARQDPELISPLSKLEEIIHRTTTVQPALTGAGGGGYDFRRLETQITGLRRDLRRKKMGVAIDNVIEGTTIVERNLETAQRRIERRKL